MEGSCLKPYDPNFKAYHSLNCNLVSRLLKTVRTGLIVLQISLVHTNAHVIKASVEIYLYLELAPVCNSL